MARRRRGGQIEGRIRETIREPDPIQIAQRLAAAGQQVPPELQKQVFQKAAADGMSSEALEQAFGMPPGTASQAAQDLGIAQQLPATLGGSMAPPGAPPPPPQQSPGQVANAIASQNQMSPQLGGGLAAQQRAKAAYEARQAAQNQPAPPSTNLDDRLGDTRIIQPDPTKGETFLPYNTSPYTAPDRNYDITGYGTMGEPAAGWGGGAQGLTEGDADFTTRRDTPETIVGNNQPPAVTTPQEMPKDYTPQARGLLSMEEMAKEFEKTPEGQAFKKQMEGYEAQGKKRQQARQNQEVLQAGGDSPQPQIDVSPEAPITPVPMEPSILIAKEDMPGYRGAGVNPMAGLPARREDANYTQAEIDAVMDAVNKGIVSPEELSQHYQFPLEEINKNIKNINMQRDKGLPVADGDYTQEEVDQVLKSLDQGNVSPEEAAAIYGVSPEYVKGQMSQAGLQTQLFDPNKSPASANATGDEIGLAGAEKALAGGLDASQTAIQEGTNAAAGQVTGGETQARTDITSGAEDASTALSSGAGAGLNALMGGIQTGRGDVTTGTNQGLTALGAGLATGRQDVRTGTDSGLQALGLGLGSARQDIMGGTEAGLGALYSGLSGGRSDLQAADARAMAQYGAGLGDIQAGRDAASQQVQQAFGRGEQMFSPYAQGGQQAHQNQLALSGALGQEAFDQAYQASPQMKFLQEQGERAIARNAAKTGGLGGGNVQKELLKYGQGVASQDLQNQIGNLQALSGQGMQAASGASGLAARGGEAQAGIQSDAAARLAAQRNVMGGSQTQMGQGLANLNVLRGQGGADMLGGAGQQLANLGLTAGTQGLQALQNRGSQMGQMAMTGGTQGLQALQGAGRDMGQMAMTGGTQGLQALQGAGRDLSQMAMTGGTQGLQTLSNLGQNLASVHGQRGLNLADVSSRAAQDRANYNFQGGMRGADYAYNTGQQLANQRIGAGRDIANNIALQSQNLANYANQQGQGLSNLYGGQGQNLQALLAGAGANTANQIGGTAAARQNAAINAASGAYGMIGGVPGKGPGMIENIVQGAGAASTALGAFSDRRLKENITQIGRENGFNIYSWNWNKKGIELGADKYPTIGVIAQEVQETRPDAVITENGYLKVDYEKLDIQVSILH